MGSSGRNRAQVKATFYVSMHWVFVAVLMLELVGALVNYNWWDAMSTEGSLGVLVIYLSLPLLLLIFRKARPPVASATPHLAGRQLSASVLWVQSSRSAGAGYFLPLLREK
jgi:hypothetical protein